MDLEWSWHLALTDLSVLKSHHLLFVAASYDGNRFITTQDGVWKVGC